MPGPVDAWRNRKHRYGLQMRQRPSISNKSENTYAGGSEVEVNQANRKLLQSEQQLGDARLISQEISPAVVLFLAAD